MTISKHILYYCEGTLNVSSQGYVNSLDLISSLMAL